MKKTAILQTALIILVSLLSPLAETCYAAELPEASDHITYQRQQQKSLEDFTVEYQNETLGISVLDFSGNYDRNIDTSFNAEARQAVLQALYANQADVYDFVYIFTTFEFDSGPAIAFATSLDNTTQGIGESLFDLSEDFFSDRLKHFIDMAALSRWGFDPNDSTYDRLLDAMLHETMHYWGISVNYLDSSNQVSDRLLGNSSSHWSYFLDSQASVMYGSSWQENAPGTFTTTDIRHGLGPLDLYLAGFSGPESVPDFFIINNADAGIRTDLPPTIGTVINGQKEVISIQDIIDHEGPRVPSYLDAQHEFNVKFVVLKSPEQTLDETALANLYLLQNAFQQRFFAATNGVGQIILPPTNDDFDISDPVTLPFDSQINNAFDLTAALNFINSKFANDHWQDAQGTQVRDTVNVIAALQSIVDDFPQTQMSLDAAILWLNNHEPINADEMAWMLISEVLNNDNRQSIEQQLLSMVNSDGGWGFDRVDYSSPYDTALVANGLMTSQSANSLLSVANRQYIIDHINTDNGVSYTEQGTSSLSASSLLLPIITAISNDPQNVTDLAQYLINTRLANNAFGSDGIASPHETALVVKALVSADNSVYQSTIDLATSALNGMQSVDGSMRGSIYSTALAVSVFNNDDKANLSFVSVDVSNDQVVRGEQIAVDFQLINSGNVQANDVTVHVYRNEIVPEALLAQHQISVLTANTMSSGSLHIDTSLFTDPTLLIVVADIENSVSESNEDDNIFTQTIGVSDVSNSAELAFNIQNISITPQQFEQLPVTVSVTAEVMNLSLLDINDVTVELNLINADGSLNVLSSQVLSIDTQSSTIQTFTAQIDQASTDIEMLVLIDPLNSIFEVNEDNNDYVLTLAKLSALDVSINNVDVNIPSPLVAGNSHEVTFVVRNVGTEIATGFDVKVYAEMNGSSQLLHQSQIAELTAGSSVNRVFTWQPIIAGDYQLRIIVDESDLLSESDEVNNRISIPLEVISNTLTNLHITENDVSFTPDPALQDQDLQLSVMVHNDSSTAVGQFMVNLYQKHDNGQPNSLLATLNNDGLAANTSVNMTFTLPTTPLRGDIDFIIEVDSDNNIVEIDENDNAVFKTIPILSKADAYVSSAGVQLSPSIPVLGLPLTVTININNLGQQNINDLTVDLYYDEAQQSSPVFIEQQVVPLLSAGQLHSVDVNFNFPNNADIDTLIVKLDQSNDIDEGDESNNEAIVQISNQSQTFYVNHRYFSPNGDGIQDSTVIAFDVDQVADHSINILDENYRLIKTFAPFNFANSQFGDVSWDGKNNDNVLVRDGEYIAQLLNTQQTIVSQTLITVDNNQSSMLKALAEDNGHYSDLNCLGRNFGQSNFARDGQSLFVRNYTDNFNQPKRGIYQIKQDGSSLSVVISETFLNSRDLLYYFVLDNGDLLFLLEESNGDYQFYIKQRSDSIIRQLNFPNGTSFNAPSVLAITENFAIIRHGFDGILRKLYFDNTIAPETFTLSQDMQFEVELSNGLLMSTFAADFPLKDLYFVDFNFSNEQLLIQDIHPDDIPQTNQGISVDQNHFVLNHQNQIQLYSTDNNAVANVFNEDATNINDIGINLHNELVVLNKDTSISIKNLNNDGIVRTETTFALTDFDNAFDSIQSVRVLLPSDNEVLIDRSTAISAFVDQALIGFTTDTDQKNMLLVIENSLTEVFDSPPCDLFFNCDSWPSTVEGKVGSVITVVNINYQDLQNISLESSSLDRESDNVFLNPFQEGRSDYVRFDGSFGQSKEILDRQNISQGLIAELNDLRSSVESSYPHFYDSDIDNFPSLIPSRRSVEVFNQFYLVSFNELGDCAINGAGHYIYRSKDNLYADVKLTRNQQAISIESTTFDVNFDRYQIHWSSSTAPNQWHLLYSDVNAVNQQVVVNWIPENSGFYQVRLQAFDKAGNSTQDIEQIAVNNSQSDITNLNVSPRSFSPDGDGNIDEVIISYEVIAPTEVLVTIANEADQIVRSIVTQYTTSPVNDVIMWDGKNDNGTLLPDGVYRIEVQGFGFSVNLDTQAIIDDELFMSLIRPEPASEGYGYVSQLAYPQDRIEAIKNINSDYFSHQFQYFDANIAQWQDTQPLAIVLNADNMVDVLNTQYRLAVTDTAGNLGFSSIQLPEQLYKKVELLKITDNDIENFEFFEGSSKIPSPMSTPRLVDWSNGDRVAYAIQAFDDKDIESITLITSYTDDQLNIITNTQLVSALPSAVARLYKPDDYVGNDSNVNGLFNIDIDNSPLPIFIIELQQSDFPETDKQINVAFVIKQVGEPLETTVVSSIQFVLTNNNLPIRLQEIDFDPDFNTESLGGNAQQAYDHIINTIPFNEDLQYIWVYQQGIFELNNETLISKNKTNGSLISTDVHTEDFIEVGDDYVSRLFILSPNACKIDKELQWRATLVDGQILTSNELIITNDLCLSTQLNAEFYVGSFCDHTANDNTLIRFNLQGDDIDVLSNRPFLVELYQLLDNDQQQLLYADTNPQLTSNAQGLFNYRSIFDYEASVLNSGEHQFVMHIYDDADNVLSDTITVTQETAPAVNIINQPQENGLICARNSIEGLEVQLAPQISVDSASPYFAQAQLIINGVNNNNSDIVYQGFNDYALLNNRSGIPELNTKLDNLNAINTPVTLLVETINVSGISVCSTVNFNLDALVDFASLDPVPTVEQRGLLFNKFSPNNDGIKDQFRLATIEANENLNIEVELFVNSQSLGAIASYNLLANNTEVINWDGQLNGALVADDNYRVDIIITDDCGLRETINIPVSVDTTDPQAIFISPIDASSLSAIQRVIIDIEEINLIINSVNIDEQIEQRISVDYLYNNVWNALDVQELSITSQTLMYQLQLDWNLTALPVAVYPLRIIIEDLAGNVSTTQITPELQASQDLFWNFGTAPLFISPNADNQQDTLTIAFGLNVDAMVDIDILDVNENLIGTIVDDQLFNTGAQQLSFNGMNNAQVLNDGAYHIRISATDVNSVANNATLVLPFNIDNTAAVVQWLYPDESVVKGTMTAQVAITENNINTLTIENQQLQPLASADTIFTAPQTGVIDLFDMSSLEETAHQLTAHVEDLAGNVTESTQNYVIDNTPPELNVISAEIPLFFTTSQTTVAINGTIIDEHFEQYDISLAQVAETPIWKSLFIGTELTNDHEFAYQWQPDVADGDYLLRITATDQAGWHTEYIQNISIDTTTPQAEITAPQIDDIIGVGEAIFGAANDHYFDFYTLSYKLATSELWQLFDTSQSVVDNGQLSQLPDTLEDGQYDIRLTVQDQAGQISESDISVILDALAPQPVTNLTAAVNNTDVSLQWQASSSGDIAQYAVYRNGQLLVTLPGVNTQYTDASLIDGDYQYWIVAIDLVGNASEASQVRQVTVDTTPPAINIINPSDGQRVNNTINVTGSAYSLLDFKDYQVYIRAINETSPGALVNTSPFAINNGLLAQIDTTSIIQESDYIIRLQATDNSGNSASQEISVFVDNIAPVAPINLTGQTQGLDGVSLQWSANNETDLAGYLVLRNGVVISGAGDGNAAIANAINVRSFIADNLPDGEHVFNIVAIDFTGNLSALSNDYIVNIDARVPDTHIITPFDGEEFESPILFEANSDDTDLASITFEYSINGFTWQVVAVDNLAPYQTTINPQNLSLNYGTVFLRATASDNNAQTDPTPAQLSVTYADLTAPEPVTSLNAIVNGADITLNWQQNSEDDLQGYLVTRIINGQATLLTNTPITNNQLIDNNLADGQYRYEVIAVDDVDNQSSIESTELLEVFSINLSQPFSPVLEPTQIQIEGQSPRSDGNITATITNNSMGTQPLSNIALSQDGQFITPVIDLNNGINDIVVSQQLTSEHISKQAVVQIEQSPIPQVPVNFQAHAIGFDAQLSWQAADANTFAYIPYKNGQLVDPEVLLTTGLSFDTSSNLFSAVNVTDGSLQTGWSPFFSDITDDMSTYFKVDFDQQRLLTAFDIQWVSDNFGTAVPSFYEVQYQSTVGWVTIANLSEDDLPADGPAIAHITTDVPYLTDSIRIVFNTPAGVFERITIAELRITHQPLITDSSITFNEIDGQYTYQVASVNNQGFISALTPAIDVIIGDVIAPDPVTLSGQIIGVNDVSLNWSASGSVDVASYWIFRNDSLIHITADATTLNYTDSALINGEYTYTVRVADAAGNVSFDSNIITLNIDQQLLEAPQNLQAESIASGATIQLSWQAVTDVELQHYRIYRSLSPDGSFNAIAETTDTQYTDTGLDNGTRYHYAVVAVDTIGNESAQSNVASAVAQDAIPAAIPVITSPTVNGSPITSNSSIVDIAGNAEAGVLVDLYINGNYTTTTRSETDFNINELSYSDDIYTIRLSQSGQWAAYTDFGDSLVVRNILTNETSRRFFDLPEFIWNNEGDKLYVTSFDDFNGGYKVSTYDTSLTEINTILSANDIISAVPSPDESQLVYQGDYFDPQTSISESGLWLYTISTGETVEIPYIGGLFTNNDGIKWSDDGQYISFINSSNNNSLHLYHVPSQSLIQIASALNDNTSHDWSPNNKNLIYDKVDGQRQLYQYDTSTVQTTQITLPNNTYSGAHYSTTGQQIIYQAQCCDVVVYDVAEQTSTTVYQTQSDILAFMWNKNHGILIVSESNLIQLTSPGGFVFNNIMLNNGINTVYVVARDDSGLPSEPSLPISIELMTSGLPDVSIDAQDVVINPLNALPTQSIVASALIKNQGDLPAIGVPIQVLMLLSDGSTVDVTPVPAQISLGAGQTQSLFIELGQVNQIGDHVLQVLLDNNSTVQEIDENNNIAFKRFSVVADLQPQLQVFVAPEQLAPDQNADISMSINNLGAVFDGELQWQITDDSGFGVMVLRHYTVQQLANNGSITVDDIWQTSGLFSGDYQLTATLLANDGSQIQQQSRNISIGAVAEFQIMLDVTNNNIIAGENLAFSTEVTYLAGNIAQTGQLNWQVTNQDNQQVIWQNSQTLPTMLPAFNATINEQWLSQNTGNYVLTLTFVADNDQQSISVPFTVSDPQLVIDLAGHIEEDPRQIILGRDFNATYQLINQGDLDLLDVDVKLSLLEAESLIEIASQTSTISLSMTQNLDIDNLFSALLLDNNNYLLVLSADLSSVGLSAEQLLDARSITSIDAQGPQITLINPQNNAVIAADADIRFTVQDQYSQMSSVQLYNPDINQGESVSFNINEFNQQYNYQLFNLVDGLHQFTISASDQYDNISQHIFNLTVDGTPPLINITGVTEGGLYNNAVTSEVLINDIHLQSSQILLDGQVIGATQLISQEGNHFLMVTAEDSVGNQSSQSLSFTIDLTAPVVDITFPANNAQLSNDSTMVVGNTEPLSQLTITVGAYTQSVQADNNGDFSFIDVPLQTGNNTIQIQAQDQATNVSQVSSITVTVVAAIDVQASINIPESAPIEQDLSVAYQLTNLTNTQLIDLPVRIQMFDGNTNELLDTQSINANLSSAQTIDQNSIFSTSALLPNKYVFLLSVFIDNQWQIKDGGQVILKDTTAPEISITVPAVDQVYDDQINSSVTVTDRYSVVQTVSYQLDNNGIWLPMVNSGTDQFIASLQLSHGQHLIKYQVTDINENTAQTDNRSFRVDNIAPQIIIANPVDGTLTNQNVQLQYQVNDDSQVDVQARLNGQIIQNGDIVTIEGLHQLSITATDQVNNTSQQSVQFIIDKTAPVLTVTDLIDGQQLDINLININGITEARASVTLDNGGVQYQTIADINGDFTFTDVQLNDGDNQLVFAATDLANNASAETIITVTFSNSGQCQIFGFKSAAPYNVLVLDEYQAQSSAVGGRIAAAGDITIDNYTIGDQLTLESAGDALISGADINFATGQVFFGNILAAGQANVGQTVIDNLHPDAQIISQAVVPVDFVNTLDELSLFSSALAQLSINSSHSLNNGVLNLQGSCQQTEPQVYQISAETLSQTHSMITDCPFTSLEDTAYVILNVTGASASFNALDGSGLEDISQKVIFNFTEAQDIGLQNSTVYGNILAINATIGQQAVDDDVIFTNGFESENNSTVIGQIVAKAWHSNGGLQHKPLQCTGNIVLDSAPIVKDLEISSVTNASLPIDLSAIDENRNTLIYQIIEEPDSGSLSGQLPSIIYQPATDFNGIDSFSYQITDDQGQISTATVRINVSDNLNLSTFMTQLLKVFSGSVSQGGAQ